MSYRGGAHVVWASEYFDPLAAGSSSSHGLAGGRSASPRDIFDELSRDCQSEERHSSHIQRYRRKFRSLAKAWFVANEIDNLQRDEILSLLRDGWNIWRPLLYVIPRAPIEATGRLILVPPGGRAVIPNPEYRIEHLMPYEFDILRWVPR
jgi:hypothetical protein